MAVLDLSELGALVECLSAMGAHDAVAEVLESQLLPLRDGDVAKWFAEVPRHPGVPLWQRCPREGNPTPFRMGSPVNEEGRFDDEDQVDVVLTEPLWVMSTSVTYGQWKLMARNAEREARRIAEPDLPVTHVSWFEARLYAHWLEHWRRKEPRPWSEFLAAVPADHRMCLPDEAQREYFTRGGTTTRFWRGDADAALDGVGWHTGNSERRLHRVAEKPPNAFGLFDVHGNAWEWCTSWYHERMRSGGEPLGPSSSSERVLRGGSYGSVAGWCRSAGRSKFSPSFAWDYFGFRLVLSAPQRPSNFDD